MQKVVTNTVEELLFFKTRSKLNRKLRLSRLRLKRGVSQMLQSKLNSELAIPSQPFTLRADEHFG